MRVNTSIGEIAMHLNEGRKYLFRPSFYAMNKIGDSDEIVDIMYSCWLGVKMCEQGKIPKDWHSLVMTVFDACLVNDEDLHDLVGFYDENLTFNEGLLSHSEALIYAYALMDKGCNGNPTDRAKKKADKDYKFNPADFVGACMAHLGSSRQDAWDMTMCEFQSAFDAKFPEDPKKKPIDQDRLSELERLAKEAHKKLPKERSSNAYKRTGKGRY